MAYQGINSVANTGQFWNGTSWAALNNISFQSGGIEISSTDPAATVARYVLRDSLGTLITSLNFDEVAGSLTFASSGSPLKMSGLLTAVFKAEGDAGNSGAGAFDISFTILGQKVRATLTGNAAITFTFPGVGNYILKLIQDGTGGWLPTIPATLYAADGTLQLATDPAAITVWSLYYDGTIVVASPVPNISPATLEAV